MGEIESFVDFEREQKGIGTQVLVERNLGYFRILTGDDFLKLREWKFDEYFRSFGLKAFYTIVKLKNTLNGWPVPLEKLEQIACLTVDVLGLGETMGRLSDRGGNSKREEIKILYGKGIVEEGLLRRLL